MTYKAVTDARKSAEARSGNVREAVRLGLEIKKRLDLKKETATRAALKGDTNEITHA